MPLMAPIDTSPVVNQQRRHLAGKADPHLLKGRYELTPKAWSKQTKTEPAVNKDDRRGLSKWPSRRGASLVTELWEGWSLEAKIQYRALLLHRREGI